jgi:hypothetical protein
MNCHFTELFTILSGVVISLELRTLTQPICESVQNKATHLKLSAVAMEFTYAENTLALTSTLTL